MEELILGARNVWESLKNKSENISSDEKFYIKFRRSIYATKNNKQRKYNKFFKYKNN